MTGRIEECYHGETSEPDLPNREQAGWPGSEFLLIRETDGTDR